MATDDNRRIEATPARGPGTNAADNAALGNPMGVLLSAGASITRVENSVISGNGYGVFITDPGTTVVDVDFDHIGTDATGTINLGNSLDGVVVQGGASGVFIVCNTIANSGGWGLVIQGEDAIGPNTFFNNIYGNELLE